MMQEVVLALSGGGARGAFHLGVLHYLDEQNIKVKAICGTSIGSIIGAGYASGVSPLQQLDILKSNQIKHLFHFNYFRGSVFTINMEHPILHQLVQKKSFEQLHIPLHVTAVDLDNAHEHLFSQGDLHKVCQASSALTPFFKPVTIDGTTYVDGGYYNHIPVDPLKQYNLPIIGVNLHPFVPNKTIHNFAAYFKRSIVASMQHNVRSAKKECAFFVESPHITKYSILSLRNFDALFQLGYDSAKENILL